MLCAQITTLGQVACSPRAITTLPVRTVSTMSNLAEQADGGVDFGGVTGGACATMDTGSEVDGLSAIEVLDDLESVGALLGVCGDEELDEEQSRCTTASGGGVLGAVDDVDEFVDLQDDLARDPRRSRRLRPMVMRLRTWASRPCETTRESML